MAARRRKEDSAYVSLPKPSPSATLSGDRGCFLLILSNETHEETGGSSREQPQVAKSLRGPWRETAGQGDSGQWILAQVLPVTLGGVGPWDQKGYLEGRTERAVEEEAM